MNTEAGTGKLFPAFTLPTGVTEEFKGIKDFFTESSNRAGEAIAQTSMRSKGSINETATKAVSTVKETTNNTLNVVVETTEKAKETLTQATNQAVTDLTAVTERAIGSVTETTGQAKASLNQMVQSTENLPSGIANALQAQLSNTIHNWIANHPVMAWFVSHPVLTLGILLLLILLLQGLFKLLAQLIEKALVLVFKSPLIIGAFLLRSTQKLLHLKRANASGETSPDSGESLRLSSDEQQAQLTQLLQRLEAINDEQSQLLQKVATLLESTKG